MATLTTDRRSGKTAAHNNQHSNVQWYDGKRRHTIHLGGKRYTKKTAERFKDIVEALLFYRRNGITTPEKSVEHWLQNAPVELRAKLAKAELLVVDEAKTCQQLWDAFLKFKAAEVKPTTMKVYRDQSVNREYDRFITMDEYGKLLAACPNQEWRTIIALARIGGLRCPSELQRLRWKDVDWEQNRFLVHSPKTERSEKHSHRLVPLFPELREELDKCDKTTEFVVQSFQGTAWSLYEPLQEISERAGLGKIRCPFVNMRRSRANDVVRQFSEAMKRMWIGHSWDVMEKHYLLQLEEDFSTC